MSSLETNPPGGPPAGWIVVMRFRVDDGRADDGGVEAFRREASAVARLLAGLAGCDGVELGRASDDGGLWLLATRWQSVGHYRRALSSYQVKVEGVPFLSRALDEPTAYEVLFAADAEGERAASGDRAADAGTVERAR